MMKMAKQKTVEIKILSPNNGQVFKLGTAPIETDPILLKANVFQDGVDITNTVEINWDLRLSYQATHKVYQTKVKTSGNLVKVKFQTGGILRIRAGVVVDKREHSTRIKTNIVGTNPSKAQLDSLINDDQIKAIAWQESTWRQFDDNGNPLIPIVKSGEKKPSMRGLFQISEWWWAEERTPLLLKDFNRMAWQWDYNLQTAKLILEYYRNRVQKNFPSESPQKQQDWTLKAYKLGPSTFAAKEDPKDFWYVVNIRNFMKDKPWLK